MPQETLQQIASEVQLFNTLEQKSNFLFLLGALTARLISLKKAAEILDLEADTLLKLLEPTGINFSNLIETDLPQEHAWSQETIKALHSQPTPAVPSTDTLRENLWTELAIALFQEERITLGTASQLTNLNQIEFQQLIADRGITVHYNVPELEQDLQSLTQEGW